MPGYTLSRPDLSATAVPVDTVSHAWLREREEATGTPSETLLDYAIKAAFLRRAVLRYSLQLFIKTTEGERHELRAPGDSLPPRSARVYMDLDLASLDHAQARLRWLHGQMGMAAIDAAAEGVSILDECIAQDSHTLLVNGDEVEPDGMPRVMVLVMSRQCLFGSLPHAT